MVCRLNNTACVKRLTGYRPDALRCLHVADCPDMHCELLSIECCELRQRIRLRHWRCSKNSGTHAGSLFALEVLHRAGVEFFEVIPFCVCAGLVCLLVFRALTGEPYGGIWDFEAPITAVDWRHILLGASASRGARPRTRSSTIDNICEARSSGFSTFGCRLDALAVTARPASPVRADCG